MPLYPIQVIIWQFLTRLFLILQIWYSKFFYSIEYRRVIKITTPSFNKTEMLKISCMHESYMWKTYSCQTLISFMQSSFNSRLLNKDTTQFQIVVSNGLGYLFQLFFLLRISTLNKQKTKNNKAGFYFKEDKHRKYSLILKLQRQIKHFHKFRTGF